MTEEVLDTIEISKQVRVEIKAYYVENKKDYKSIRITKHKKIKGKWKEQESVSLSSFGSGKMREFLALLTTLTPDTKYKNRILSQLKLDVPDDVQVFLRTEKGMDIMRTIAAEDPKQFEENILAVETIKVRKQALETFKKLIDDESYDKEFYTEYRNKYGIPHKGEEPVLQHFFERNDWIFGYGLHYVFFTKANESGRSESTTTAPGFNNAGNKVDAFMRTQADISHCVFIEIKKVSEPILKNKEYRSGCYPVTCDLSDAVAQIQKTVCDFVEKNGCSIRPKDEQRNYAGYDVYLIKPKSFLVIGKLKSMEQNEDKIKCFQSYRRSLLEPEIITYDELYERAKCIVDLLSSKNSGS